MTAWFRLLGKESQVGKSITAGVVMADSNANGSSEKGETSRELEESLFVPVSIRDSGRRSRPPGRRQPGRRDKLFPGCVFVHHFIQAAPGGRLVVQGSDPGPEFSGRGDTHVEPEATGCVFLPEPRGVHLEEGRRGGPSRAMGPQGSRGSTRCPTKNPTYLR